jgi:two-component SAPR family response regulator
MLSDARSDATRAGLRAGLAFVTAAALIVGVPILLAALAGSPIPRTVPDVARVREFLAGSVSPNTLIDVLVHLLASLCWATWALLAVVFVGETIAAIQHRSTRSIGRAGGIQHVARTLVTTIAIGVATLRPGQPVDAALPARPRVAVTVGHGPAAPVRPIRDEPTWHTVSSRSTLLDVAHARLGASHRWREIWELNRGQVMNDGSRFDRPEVLHRGWRLRLPAPTESHDATPFRVASPRPDPDIHVVEPGDTLSEIVSHADGRPATATQVRDVFDANRGVTDWRGTHPLEDPDLINPGMRLDLSILDAVGGPVVGNGAAPPPVADAGTATPPRRPATLPTVSISRHTVARRPVPPVTLPTPRPAPTSAPKTATISRPDTASRTSPFGTSREPARPGDGADGATLEVVAGLALLSSGALAVAKTLRQRRLRASQPGELAPLADPDLSRVERGLRAAAASHDGNRLARALRSLGEVRPLALRQRTDGSIEALLAAPLVRPPRPWTSTAGGNVAILHAKSAVPDTDMAPRAALVQLGSESDGSAIYVDLETGGGLGIDATGEALACLARAVVATLASAAHAGALHVHTLGFDATGIDPLGRVELHDDREQLRDAITVRDRDELNVVVTTTRFDADDIPDTSGLVIVGPRTAGPDRRWCLSVAGEDRWRLEPLGLVLTPSGLGAAELAELAAYYLHAGAPLDPPHETPPDHPVAVPRSAVLADHRDTESVDDPNGPPWRLMIRVFGSVDVVNRDGESPVTDRRKAIEALVWFVEHRDHGHRAAMQNALWNYEPSPDTVQNVVSEARRILRSLAAPPTGEDWLDRSLRLHPLVVSDAELVAAALKGNIGDDDADAIRTLEHAVALIRGAPLADVTYLWADGESIPSRLTLLAVRAAAELADLHLEHMDADAALRATEIGLRVLPGHEHLVCLRMHAHAVRGDYASVRAEYESYERLVLRDEFSAGEVSHEVTSAYQRFCRPDRIRPSS